MLLAAGALFANAASLNAANLNAAEFYQGKTISIIVGSDAGGGFDAFARLLSRRFGSVVPGAPTVIVENLPGAGSAIAASYVYAKAPKDGTVIGALVPSGLLTPLFEHRAAAYDTTKFRFLGSAGASARLCFSLKRSPIATWADAMRARVIVGAGAVASASYDYAYLHKHVHGGNFDVVAGYKGTAEILLAMERGEVEATCGLDRSSLRAQRPDQLRDGGFNLLLKVSVKPDTEPDAQKIPEARSFARNDRDRAISDLIAAQQIFGRPYVVAPGVPGERLAILRRAFDTLMMNPQFIAEAAAAGLAIDATDGDTVETAVQGMYAAAPEILEATRAAIRP